MASKKVDLRKYLVPIGEYNINPVNHNGQNFTVTTDLVKIDSAESLKYNSRENNRKLATDFAVDNCAIQDTICTLDNDRPTCSYWTSDCTLGGIDIFRLVNFVYGDGTIAQANTIDKSIGICPVIQFDLSPFIKENKDFSNIIKIKTVKSMYGKKHLLEMGEYPKTNASDEEQAKLESLYNGGKLMPGITATGRLYTTNGQKFYGYDFLSKQNSEFEMDGKNM